MSTDQIVQENGVIQGNLRNVGLDFQLHSIGIYTRERLEQRLRENPHILSDNIVCLIFQSLREVHTIFLCDSELVGFSCGFFNLFLIFLKPYF